VIIASICIVYAVAISSFARERLQVMGWFGLQK